MTSNELRAIMANGPGRKETPKATPPVSADNLRAMMQSGPSNRSTSTTDAQRLANTLDVTNRMLAGSDIMGRAPATQQAQTTPNGSRVGNALKSIGNTLAGSVVSLAETGAQGVKNTVEELQNDEFTDTQRAIFDAKERLRFLERSKNISAQARKDYDATTAELEQLQAKLDSLQVKTSVGADSLGQKTLQKAAQQKEAALDGTGKVGRWVGENLMSVGQNAALLPFGLINPAIPLAAMATVSAGSKAAEVNATGAAPGEALIRGAVSGGIEALTEKIPVDNLLDMVKVGGKSAIKNLLKQAGTEAGEESVSYVLNYIADKAAGDPNATFTLKELANAAGSGAFSGGLMGGGATLIGNAINPSTTAENKNTAHPEAGSTAFEETESTIVNTDPSAHTKREQEIIEAYQGGTDETLKEVFEEYIANPEKGFSRQNISSVSEKQAKDAETLLGGNYRGYKNAINANGIRHIIIEHGPQGKTDHSLANVNDMARMGYVLDNYDDVEVVTYESGDIDYSSEFRDSENNPAPMLKFSKKVNGTYYVVEAIPESKYKKFWVVSAYMEKADGGTQAPNAQGPGNTPNASLASSQSAFGSSITDSEPVVKTPPIAPRPTPVLPPIFKDGKVVNPDDSVGAAPAGFDPYSQAMFESGQLKPGENPFRVVDNPAAIGDVKVSQSVQTATEAEATPTEMLGEIGDAVLSKKTGLTYITVDNDATTASAREVIKNKGSFETAVADWTADARSGKNSEVMTAMGALLYNEAANSGNTRLALSILSDYCTMVRRGARSVQAARILKRLSPQDKLIFVQQTVNNMNEKLAQKAQNRPSRSDNVDVELWMQRVGETLADRFMRTLNVDKSKAKTVSETVMADLRKHMDFLKKESTQPLTKEQRQARSAEAKQRRMDALANMANNRAQYQDAWDAAKATVADAFENDPEALNAFEWWLDDSMNAAKQLTQELTGQTNIVIDERLADAYLTADTDEARDAALKAIIKDIAGQTPSTLADKFTALRYTNMLGNLRTQTRNVGGNLINMVVRGIDSKVQALLQLGYKKDSGKRTVTFLLDKPLYEMAKQSFTEHQKEAMGQGKYADWSGSGLMSDINEARTIFKNNGTWGTREASSPLLASAPVRAVRWGTNYINKALEGARVLTRNAMEVGDVIFSKHAYADALARYLKAKGYSAEQWQNDQIPQDVMDEAVAHAIRSAQEATFRDDNQFSEMVSAIGFKNVGDNKAKAAANAVLQGVLPFRKTPANIAVQAAKHSPIGLVDAAVSSIKKASGDTNISGTDIIQKLSEGLTGTGLLLAGYFLAKQGLATGGRDRDEEAARMDDLMGEQEYSFYVPSLGESFSYDAFTPASMPFAVGVELYNAVERNGGWTGDTVLDSIAGATEVALNMSMLSGLNDAFENVSYSDYPLVDVVLDGLLGYMTQGLTSTLGGQIERITESERTTTFRDKQGALPTDTQYAVGSAMNKLPGEFNQIPYIDAWGRREDTGTVGERIIGNMIAPWYSSELNVTPADTEIMRLLDEGYTGVAPDRVAQSYEVTYRDDPEDEKNKKRYMTADEYVEFSTIKGQTSFDIVSEMIGSDIYDGMTDEQKADALALAYTYANHIASAEITDGKHVMDKKYELAQTADKELGVSEAEYLLLCEKYGAEAVNGDNVRNAHNDGMDVEAFLSYTTGKNKYNTDGKQGYTTAETAAAINGSGLSKDEQTLLWLIEKPEWGEKAAKYEIAPDIYVDFKEATIGIEADKNAKGEAISGSKKRKILKVLNEMGVSPAVLNKILEAEGYSTK